MFGILCRESLTFSWESEQVGSSDFLRRPGLRADRPLVWFVGRLDNRQELALTLSLPQTVQDSEIILAAYSRWGYACPSFLLGEFASVLWDPVARSLLCFRDRFGIRPLYYAVTPRVFVFASELSSILSCRWVSSALNDGMLAEYLIFDIQSEEETLFAAVKKVRPRHSLLVTATSITSREYWFPNLDPLHFPSDAACAEEFVYHLRNAVRTCLPRDGRAATYLSGGLDSSAVTAIACQLVPPDELITCSNVYPGQTADESFYIRHITARYRVKSHLIPFTPPPQADYFAVRASHYRDFPGFPNGGALNYHAAVRLRTLGVQVVLGGQFGNHLLEGYQSVMADDLLAFRWKSFVRQCRGYQQGGSFWRTAYWGAIRPALPKPPWLRRIAGHRSRNLEPLSPQFVRRSGIIDRVTEKPNWRLYGSRALRDLVTALFSAQSFHFLDHITRNAAEHGLQECFPFLDTRLVEFCLRIPEHMRQRDGVWKFVLRQAMAPYLPEVVLRRRVQAEFSEPSYQIIDGIRLPDPELLADYVTPTFLAALRCDYRNAIGGGLFEGWPVAGVNFFLAAEAARSASPLTLSGSNTMSSGQACNPSPQP